MNIDDFAGREGEAFPAASEAHPQAVELSLTSVTTLGSPTTEDGRQPFSLILHGPVEPMLPQGTHHFEHTALGSFDMFIVPLGPDQAGMQYQAVFG